MMAERAAVHPFDTHLQYFRERVPVATFINDIKRNIDSRVSKTCIVYMYVLSYLQNSTVMSKVISIVPACIDKTNIIMY